MKTLTQTKTASYREKGSRFIGHLFPAERKELFERKLDQLKSEYHDATHHCYAYRIGVNEIREAVQDDGEPSGTAGLPILNQLKSYEVVNAGLVVVRYFGGTKLGKSGLISAYGETAKQCLDTSHLHKLIQTENFELTYPYPQQNRIDKLKATHDLIELEAEYQEKITLTLACPLENSEQLFKKLRGMQHLDIHFNKLGRDFVSQ